MKIYGIPGCPFVNRVQIGLATRGLSGRVQVEFVNLDDPPAGLLRINPLGSVPTLEFSTGDGFNESIAILQFLDSVEAPGPRLFGPPQATGKLLALLELVKARFLDALHAILYAKGNRPKRQAAIARFPQAVAAMDSLLEEHASQGLFGGANPNGLDCALAPFLMRLNVAHDMVADIPELPAQSRTAKYAERLLSHDLVRGALPGSDIVRSAMARYVYPSAEVKDILAAPREVLSNDAAAAAHAQLPSYAVESGTEFSGWMLERDAKGPLLRGTFRFTDGLRAIAALDALNDLQETADHHAASTLTNLSELKLEICTHEPVWGLSHKDFALASAIAGHTAFR